jgi:hypothetical protein
MQFQDVIGQDETKHRLIKSFEEGRLAHALMLLGPRPLNTEVRLADLGGELAGRLFNVGCCLDGEEMVSAELLRGIQSGT